MTAYTVVWSGRVEKQLAKLADHVTKKFYTWVASVKLLGLGEVRKISGYHDEPLRGSLAGLRSIRLNKFYRGIYRERLGGTSEFIEVIEVNKHDYKKMARH